MDGENKKSSHVGVWFSNISPVDRDCNCDKAKSPLSLKFRFTDTGCPGHYFPTPRCFSTNLKGNKKQYGRKQGLQPRSTGEPSFKLHDHLSTEASEMAKVRHFLIKNARKI